MKKTIQISLLALGLFSMQNAQSQCKGFTNKLDLSIMKSFECEGLQVAQMYEGDYADLEFKLEAGKRYRFLLLAQSFIGKPNLEFSSKKDSVPAFEILDTPGNCYDVMVSENKKVTLNIQVPKSEKKTYMETPGCVALSVGVMEQNELVISH